MQRTILFLFIALTFSSNLFSQILIQTDLFNGQNFDGWDVVVKDKGIQIEQDLFTVHDNLIHAYEKQEHNSLQPFGGILTKEEFSNFHFSLEYKWGKKKFKPREVAVRDAGILFHIKDDVSIWPSSIECQIQEGDTGDMWIIKSQTSSKVQNTTENYDPSGKMKTKGIYDGYARFPRSYSWENPDWNKVDIIVNKDHAIFKVNGHIVNEAINMKRWDSETSKWEPRVSGQILLQAEGAEIFYRNITLTTIK